MITSTLKALIDNFVNNNLITIDGRYCMSADTSELLFQLDVLVVKKVLFKGYTLYYYLRSSNHTLLTRALLHRLSVEPNTIAIPVYSFSYTTLSNLRDVTNMCRTITRAFRRFNLKKTPSGRLNLYLSILEQTTALHTYINIVLQPKIGLFDDIIRAESKIRRD